MRAFITALAIVGGVVLLALALRWSAKVHTKTRADQVWAAIERRYGPQHRVDWLYARDDFGAPMEIAISEEGFYGTLEGSVGRFEWEKVSRLLIDPGGSGADRFILVGNLDGVEATLEFDINIPGQGDTAYPIREGFLRNLARTFEANRAAPSPD